MGLHICYNLVVYRLLLNKYNNYYQINKPKGNFIMKILNLTQHPATEEQVAAGVVDLCGHELQQLKKLLTFDDIPEHRDMLVRACEIASLASGYDKVMIGGAPFFMSTLESVLYRSGKIPCYAFSKRESAEEIQEDGSVRKINIFKHVGFVEA